MKTKYRYGSREPGLPCTSRVGGARYGSFNPSDACAVWCVAKECSGSWGWNLGPEENQLSPGNL